MRACGEWPHSNIAGGVAGGVAGIGPLTAGGLALLASFLMMAGGHLVGRTLGGSLPLDPRLAAGATFVALALAQGVEAAQSLGTGLYMYERLGKRGA